MTETMGQQIHTPILVITSDVVAMKPLIDAIRAEDIAVDVESTVSQAMGRLRAGGVRVAVVDADRFVGDVEMFLGSIRRSQPETALMVTASGPSTTFLIRLIHTGIYDFFLKPFDPSKIAAAIRGLSERGAVTDDADGRDGARLNSTIDHTQAKLFREVCRTNEELQDLNKTLRKNVSQLTILYQMGRDISDNENWSDALDRFLMALVNYTKADGAALLLFSEEGRRLSPRASFQIDPAVLELACGTLVEKWSANPRGNEIHSFESYEEGVFNPCLERNRPWRFTIIPIVQRNRKFGFLCLEKLYRSSLPFKVDYHFFNATQTILTEEVVNASYISELRQIGRFNQRVLDNISSGVLTTDLEGRVRFYNEVAAGMTPRVGGKTLTHFDDVFRSATFGENFYQKMLDSTKDTHVLEVQCVRDNEHEFPARLSISKMHDDNLNGTVLVAIFEDLTEQRRLESEIRRNDRLRALGQLSAGVAHEIRNPLTGIATTAEVLAGKLENDPDKIKYTRAILEEIHRLDRIIRNLLDFARPAKPQFKPCHLGRISDKVVALLTEQANKKGVALEVREQIENDTCLADSNQITQVLLNMVLNSIQACHKGDRVEILLRNEKDDKKPAGKCARVDVFDTGPGVPREVRNSLFDPFVTTKTNGTGLGLAISQQIIDEHKGRIDCEFLEKGTRFTIRLPVEDKKTNVTERKNNV